MNSQYYKGSLWFLSHVLVSSINDAIQAFLGQDLPSFEIVTLRFAFSVLTLFLIMIPKGVSAFKTQNIWLHVLRGFLLFVGITIWVVCLHEIHIVIVTLMTFTIPIFFMILAYFFLDEKIGFKQVSITMAGFIGIIIALDPFDKGFHPVSLALIIAVICFALLDVINKKYISRESTVNMLFYSALFTLIFSAVPTYLEGWVAPNNKDLMLCFVLGTGANLMLYTVLKAFSYANATALAPLRYTELIFSAIIAYFLFNQVPNDSLYIAAAIIIPCNIVLMSSNSKKMMVKND